MFDKAADRVFWSGMRSLAAENYFYDLEAGDEVVVSLEPALSESDLTP